MKKKMQKNITLDDLAIMVAKGFNDVDKRLENVEDRLTTVEDELGKVKDVVKNTRQDVLNIGDKFISHYEFDRLAVRVGKLESDKDK